MPVDYGASVEGVRALLPHRGISETTKPSDQQVERFLEAASRWVTARAGALDPASALYAHARTATELRAAAMAEDAAYPERSGRAGSGYGEVLWARANEALEEIVEVIGPEPIIDPTDPTTAGKRPAFSFPEPAWRRTAGF